LAPEFAAQAALSSVAIRMDRTRLTKVNEVESETVSLEMFASETGGLTPARDKLPLACPALPL
jgi:hypothetical protein